MTAVPKIVFFCIPVMIGNCSFSQRPIWKLSTGIHYFLPGIQYTSHKGGNVGFDIGLYSEMKLAKKTAVETGIFYTKSIGKIQRGFIYPPNYPFLDAPEVDERLVLHALKMPLSLLMKQQKRNPNFLSFGVIVNYYLSAKRWGYVARRQSTYAGSIEIDGKNGGNVGLGALLGIGKVFQIKKKIFAVRLNYDVDLTKWRYPTNFDIEARQYYSLRSQNFAVIAFFVL